MNTKIRPAIADKVASITGACLALLVDMAEKLFATNKSLYERDWTRKGFIMQTSSLFNKAAHRPLRAKLIFNANSVRPADSPQQLASIPSEMQDHNILPEVLTVRPDTELEEVVRSAIKSGIKLIVVAGGDGTIDNIIGAMVGGEATPGIIPTGTRNNV